MFHCRDKELHDLNKRYKKNDFECIVVYGRRRVGKTALINEFCKGKPIVFFSALNASSQENLEALSKAIYEKDHPGAETAPVYPSFDAAFTEITRMAEEERLVFVIDEYPYLAKANKSISSRLQHIIDHIWKNGKLFLILCGSSMSFMEEQVLGYQSPLYGSGQGGFQFLRFPAAVQKESAALLELGDDIVFIEEGLVVAGHEVCLFHQIGGEDGLFAEAQMAAGDAEGLLGIVLEVGLGEHIGVVADDLDGVFVGAHGAVAAQPPELAADHLLVGQRQRGEHGQGAVGHIVLDAHGEAGEGRVGEEMVKDGLDLHIRCADGKLVI